MKVAALLMEGLILQQTLREGVNLVAVLCVVLYAQRAFLKPIMPILLILNYFTVQKIDLLNAAACPFPLGWYGDENTCFLLFLKLIHLQF